ncbi:MAG: OmpA family protein, partial [Myxococcales bacterium]|nr:OmpA family protein [Myxococcales bacterium]
MGRIRGTLTAAAVGLAGLATTAQAQDIQGFKPAVGTWNYLSVDGGRVAPVGQFVPSLYLSYGRNPLVKRDPDGTVIQEVIENLTTVDFMLAVGVHERVELGVDIPFSYSSGINPEANLDIDDGGGLGDIRLLPKFLLLGHDSPTGFGLGVALPTSFPTGEKGQSSRAFVISPRAVLEYRHDKFRIAANAGYRWRPVGLEGLPDLTVGAGYQYGLAASVNVMTPKVQFLAEGYGTRFTKVSETQAGPNPLEALFGFRFFNDIGLSLSLAGGIGIVPDYGSPEFRVIGGLSWLSQDERVVVAGMNGQMGGTGDKDGDGIRDGLDACLDEPEDKDGFEDADGCPDTDNDRDGIADAADKCPMHAEDLDRFQDEDGCPEPDNDQDGIADLVDRCPNEPETKNGDRDEDGCPDTSLIVVQDGEIRILQKVFFETARAVIKPESFEVLNQVAEAMQYNPQIAKIRVEGHTDSRGGADYNKRLSEERAASVALYLIGRGIEPSRVESQGYGEERKLSTEDSVTGMAMNRRVEFRIVARNQALAPAGGGQQVIDSASTPEAPETMEAMDAPMAPAAAMTMAPVEAPAAGDVPATPGNLNDVRLESQADALRFIFETSAAVPRANVDLQRDSGDQVLVIRLDQMATGRKWVKLEDGAIKRSLVLPSKELARAAVLRVRFKDSISNRMFGAIRVNADARTVTVDLPRSDAVAAHWGEPAAAPAVDPYEASPAAVAPMNDGPAPDVAADLPADPGPAMDAPAMDAPAMDAPALDAPALDAPAMDAPALDAP